MTKGCFTLHWNCCEDSWKCRRRFKLFAGLFVDVLDSLKQGTTGNWILMTQMLAPANSAWLCWLSWCSGNYTVKHKQVFLLSGWTVRSWTCIHLQFVSSNNLDVETTEQFILLHTRYVCDFSGLTNFSQKLWNSKKIFISYFVYFFGFLAFDQRWVLWCLPRKEVSPWDCLLISKVSYRTVYSEMLFPWPPVCLLAFEKVVSFFICEEC